MKVLLVGATGVLGRAMLPILASEGHDVLGTSRSPEGVRSLEERGARGAVLDVYDDAAVRALLEDFQPDALISQVTDLPDDPAELAARLGANARVRREAIPRLVEAATQAGVDRILVQSVAWPMTGEGAGAVDTMERATLAAGGVVVRYGQLHGPGTFHAEPPDGPSVGVSTAAERTCALLGEATGIVTVLDRDPAE